jgi:hypothetical protein
MELKSLRFSESSFCLVKVYNFSFIYILKLLIIHFINFTKFYEDKVILNRVSLPTFQEAKINRS